jgi:hypothetical protein
LLKHPAPSASHREKFKRTSGWWQWTPAWIPLHRCQHLSETQFDSRTVPSAYCKGSNRAPQGQSDQAAVAAQMGQTEVPPRALGPNRNRKGGRLTRIVHLVTMGRQVRPMGRLWRVRDVERSTLVTLPVSDVRLFPRSDAAGRDCSIFKSAR